MKRQIRVGVFETNSSSTHSLTICTPAQYKQWNEGKLACDFDTGKFETLDELMKMDPRDAYNYFTIESLREFLHDISNGAIIADELTTPRGERVVLLGYHGYDG